MRRWSIWRALLATAIAFGGLMLTLLVTPEAAWAAICTTDSPEAQVIAVDAAPHGGFLSNASGNRESVWVNADVNDACARISSIFIYDAGRDAQAEVGFVEATSQAFCHDQSYSGNHIFMYWKLANSQTADCHVYGAQNPSQYRNLTIQSVTSSGVFSAYLGLNPPTLIGSTAAIGIRLGLPINNGERHWVYDSEYSRFASEMYLLPGQSYTSFYDVDLYRDTGDEYHCVWKATDSNYVANAPSTCH